MDPSDYLKARPASYIVPATPISLYVEMADGCRIAIDVWLPQAPRAGGPSTFPTIVILTPYYRRFALKEGTAGIEASPNSCRYREMFVPRGYAVVVVDVRGTGASFGVRDSFRSPKERDDYRQIADWIIAQEWSDGQIGSTGISYLGAASTFLASTGHPAVKAIAPLFAVWDTYTDHYYPGGVLLNQLARAYDELMVALDHDRRDLLQKLPYFSDPNFSGPCPVDSDRDGDLSRAAVEEHRGNFRMPDFISEFRFRDDRLPYDPEFGSHSFSPYSYAATIPPDVAIYSISGWMDGAGFTNGAIARFLSLDNPNHFLLLGPWDHGARVNVSPWRDSVEPKFDVFAETLRFFDTYLLGLKTGMDREPPVRYYTMHEERWRSAPHWPPIDTRKRLFLSVGDKLTPVSGDAGKVTFKVDFTVGTGSHSRYERLAAYDTRDYYRDWQGRDEKLQCYTSEPLAEAAEMSGHPVLTLWISSSESDAALHVYLSEVESDGRVHYVTEGILRALHREESSAPRYEKWTWPYHGFMRADAHPLPINTPTFLRFALLPTSWRFAKGSRLRLALAGADSDHYAQVPHGRPPVLTVHHGSDHATMLELPWRISEQT
jgi:uncharacterized protein